VLWAGRSHVAGGSAFGSLVVSGGHTPRHADWICGRCVHPKPGRRRNRHDLPRAGDWSSETSRSNSPETARPMTIVDTRLPDPKRLISGTTGDWEIIIGMEIHAQVTSNSKLFSGASTSFGSEPNANVSLV